MHLTAPQNIALPPHSGLAVPAGTGGALCWLGLGPPRAPSRMGLTGGLLAHAYVVRGPDGLLVDRGYARRPGGLAHFRLEEGDTVRGGGDVSGTHRSLSSSAPWCIC